MIPSPDTPRPCVHCGHGFARWDIYCDACAAVWHPKTGAQDRFHHPINIGRWQACARNQKHPLFPPGIGRCLICAQKINTSGFAQWHRRVCEIPDPTLPIRAIYNDSMEQTQAALRARWDQQEADKREEAAERARERAEQKRQAEIQRQQAEEERQQRLRTLGDWIALNATEFEHECARLLRAAGYDHVTVTQASGDGGIDVIAQSGEQRYAVQCKKYRGVIDPTDVRALAGVASINGYTGAIFMTTGTMTPETLRFAQRAQMTVYSGQQLVDLARRVTPVTSAVETAA
jgi:restriction endonuclease Mrr